MDIVEVLVVGNDFVSPWGPIGNPPKYVDGELSEMDDTFFILPEDLQRCMCSDGFKYDGVTAIANGSDALKLVTPVGEWLYKVYAVIWTDGDDQRVCLARRL